MPSSRKCQRENGKEKICDVEKGERSTVNGRKEG